MKTTYCSIGKDKVLFSICITLIILSLLAFMALPWAMDVTLTSEEIKTERIDYQIVHEGTSDLELGQSRTKTKGVPGEKNVVYKVTRKMLSGEEVSREQIAERYVKQPVNEVIQDGATRYRFMWCSGDYYQYYEEDTFNSNPDIGFTWSGEDACAKNGPGHRTNVSNSPPPPKTNYYYDDDYSGGAICNDGTRSYSTGKGTCSHHDGVWYWL